MTGPHILQLSIFLQNRLGALQKVTRTLESENIRICAISIVDAADHAVARMVVDRPAFAIQALSAQGYSVFETELLGVALPVHRGVGIRKVLSALLVAEVNVHYLYSLMIQAQSDPVLAIHVDDPRAAERVLQQQGLRLVGQDDLEWPAAGG